jgi:hypothetical protein
MTYVASIDQGRYSADAVEPLGIPGVARQLTAGTASANTTLTANVSRISIRARFCDIRYVVGVGTQTAKLPLPPISLLMVNGLTLLFLLEQALA